MGLHFWCLFGFFLDSTYNGPSLCSWITEWLRLKLSVALLVFLTQHEYHIIFQVVPHSLAQCLSHSSLWISTTFITFYLLLQVFQCIFQLFYWYKVLRVHILFVFLYLKEPSILLHTDVVLIHCFMERWGSILCSWENGKKKNNNNYMVWLKTRALKYRLH